MTSFDINQTASSVLGIAGMGIGIGLLAHTAKNISNMTDEMYHSRRREIRQTPRRAQQRAKQRKPTMYDNYWGTSKTYW